MVTETRQFKGRTYTVVKNKEGKVQSATSKPSKPGSATLPEKETIRIISSKGGRKQTSSFRVENNRATLQRTREQPEKFESSVKAPTPESGRSNNLPVNEMTKTPISKQGEGSLMTPLIPTGYNAVGTARGGGLVVSTEARPNFQRATPQDFAINTKVTSPTMRKVKGFQERLVTKNTKGNRETRDLFIGKLRQTNFNLDAARQPFKDQNINVGGGVMVSDASLKEAGFALGVGAKRTYYTTNIIGESVKIGAKEEVIRHPIRSVAVPLAIGAAVPVVGAGISTLSTRGGMAFNVVTGTAGAFIVGKDAYSLSQSKTPQEFGSKLGRTGVSYASFGTGYKTIGKPTAEFLTKPIMDVATIRGRQHFGTRTSTVSREAPISFKSPDLSITQPKSGLKSEVYKVDVVRPTISVGSGKGKTSSLRVAEVGGTTYSTLKTQSRLGKLLKKDPIFIRQRTSGEGTVTKIFRGDQRIRKISSKPQTNDIGFTDTTNIISTKQPLINAKKFNAEVNKNLGIRTSIPKSSKEGRQVNINTLIKEGLVVKQTSPEKTTIIGKPVYDLIKGKVYPDSININLRDTSFKFVDYPTTPKKVIVEKLSSGERVITKPPTFKTVQKVRVRQDYDLKLKGGNTVKSFESGIKLRETDPFKVTRKTRTQTNNIKLRGGGTGKLKSNIIEVQRPKIDLKLKNKLPTIKLENINLISTPKTILTSKTKNIGIHKLPTPSTQSILNIKTVNIGKPVSKIDTITELDTPTTVTTTQITTPILDTPIITPTTVTTTRPTTPIPPPNILPPRPPPNIVTGGGFLPGFGGGFGRGFKVFSKLPKSRYQPSVLGIVRGKKRKKNGLLSGLEIRGI